MKVARLTCDETIISILFARYSKNVMQVGTPCECSSCFSIGRWMLSLRLLQKQMGRLHCLRMKEKDAIVSLNSNERDKTTMNGLITLGDACREKQLFVCCFTSVIFSGEVWPNDISRQT